MDPCAAQQQQHHAPMKSADPIHMSHKEESRRTPPATSDESPGPCHFAILAVAAMLASASAGEEDKVPALRASGTPWPGPGRWLAGLQLSGTAVTVWSGWAPRCVRLTLCERARSRMHWWSSLARARRSR